MAFYFNCECGALLRVAKGWDVWACGLCGASSESRYFTVAAASESATMLASIHSRSATGVESPMNAPGQSAYEEANMVADIVSKAGV